MLKKTIVMVLIPLLALVLGCAANGSSRENQTMPADLEVLRKAILASKWEVHQMQFTVSGGSDLPVLMKLTEGDRVDGYFYIETGDSIAFTINGNSLIYRSTADNSEWVTSDRFSFTSSREQGTTYTLNFSNTAGNGTPRKVTVFLEIIFPSTGQVFIPVAIK